MATQRSKNLEDIGFWFRAYEISIDQDKALNHQDELIESENFFCNILNFLFGWNLQNANDSIGNSQEGYDLFDKESKVAVQVTATTGSQKIRHTLRHFVGKFDSEFDRLIFVHPVTKLPIVKVNFEDEFREFDFDVKRDVLGLGHLIREAQKLSVEEQRSFIDILADNLLPLIDLEGGKHGVEGAGATLLQNQRSSFGRTSLSVALSDLSLSRDRELEEAKKCLRRGEVVNALKLLLRLKTSGSWQQLDGSLKGRCLKLLGILAWNSGDSARAVDYFREGEGLLRGGDGRYGEVLMELSAGNPEQALMKLGEPSDLGLFQLKAEILLGLENYRELKALLSNDEFSETAEACRIRALLLLRKGLFRRALQVAEEALRLESNWFEARETEAIICYYGTVSAASPHWGRTDAPFPISPIYVRTDKDGVSFQLRARRSFESLLEVDGLSANQVERLYAWLLATYANAPRHQDEAEQLARRVITEYPGNIPMICFALERGLNFPVDLVEEELTHSIMENPTVQNVHTLVCIHIKKGMFSDAAELLKKYRSVYEELGETETWAVQLSNVVAMGGEGLGLKGPQGLAVGDLAQNQLCIFKSARGKLAQVELQEFAQRSEALNDPEHLFFACLAHNDARRFDFTLKHGKKLIQTFQSETCLRVVMAASLGSELWSYVLELLERFGSLFGEKELPPDIQRVRITCLRKCGRFREASDELLRIDRMDRDLTDKFDLMQVLQLAGDSEKANVVARELVGNQSLPDEGLVEIAERVLPSSPELAKRAIGVLENRGTSNYRVAAAAYQLSTFLGIENSAAGLLETALRNIGKDDSLIRLYDLEEIKEIFSNDQMGRNQRLEEYRKGVIPVHTLIGPNCSLAEILVVVDSRGTLGNTRTDGEMPFFIRHGSQGASRLNGVRIRSKHIYLDVTSLILLHYMGLLEHISDSFLGVQISVSTFSLIQTEQVKLSQLPLSEIRSLQKILKLHDTGQILTGHLDSAVSSGEPNPISGMGLAKNESNPPMRVLILESKCSMFGIEYIDLLSLGSTLSDIGEIDDEKFARFLAKIDDEAQQYPGFCILPQTKIIVSEEVAVFLAESGIFPEVCRCFEVWLMASDLDRIRKRRTLYETRKLVSKKLDGLRELLLNWREIGVLKEVRDCIADRSKVGAEDQPSFGCLLDTVDGTRQSDVLTCVDDRRIGAIRRIGRSRVVGSLDVLYLLWTTGGVGEALFYQTLSRLRSLNLRYIWLDVTELVWHLEKCSIRNGTIVENLHMEVIRAYHSSLVNDSSCLQRPDRKAAFRLARLTTEFRVILDTCNVILDALLDIWSSEWELRRKQICSSWLVESLWLDSAFTEVYLPDFEFPDRIRGTSREQLLFVSMRLSSKDGTNYAEYLEWLFLQFGAEPEQWGDALRSMRRFVVEFGIAPGENERMRQRAALGFLGKLSNALPLELSEFLEPTSNERSDFGLPDPTTLGLGGYEFSSRKLWESLSGAVECGRRVSLFTNDEPPQKFSSDLIVEDSKVVGVKIDFGGGEALKWREPFLLALNERLAEDDLNLIRIAIEIPSKRSQQIAELVEEKDMASRMNGLLQMFSSSLQFELQRVTDSVRKEKKLGVHELGLIPLDALLNDVRLSRGMEEWSVSARMASSASALMEDYSLVDAIVRFSAMPLPLPRPIIEKFLQLKRNDIKRLIEDVRARSGSPLSLVHLVNLCIECREKDLALGMVFEIADEKMKADLDLFAVILRWAFYSNLKLLSGDASPLDLCLGSWILAGRLHQSLGQVSDPDDLASYFRDQTPPVGSRCMMAHAALAWSFSPSCFKPLALVAGVASRCIAHLDLDREESRSLGSKLRGQFFPYSNFPEVFDLHLNNVFSTKPRKFRSLCDGVHSHRFRGFPNLEGCVRLFGREQAEDIQHLVNHLIKDPNHLASWKFLEVRSEAILNYSQIDQISQCLNRVDPRSCIDHDSATILVQALVVLGQIDGMDSFSVDWERIFKFYGSCLFEKGGRSDAIGKCLGNLALWSVRSDNEGRRNVSRFCESLRWVCGGRPQAIDLFRPVLSRIVIGHANSSGAELWKLLLESRSSTLMNVETLIEEEL